METVEPAATLQKVDRLLRVQAWQQVERLLAPLQSRFPRSADVLVARAKLACMRSEFKPARDYLEHALAIEPNHRAGLATLGVVCQLLGDADGALFCLERAHALAPQDPEVMGNLGHVYTMHARMDEAIELLERALTIAPDSAVLRNNLGRAFVENGRFEEALVHLNHALRINPRYNSALYNRGMALLGTGSLETGWAEWEHRFNADCTAKRSPTYGSLPMWQGESLVGKRILVYAEQGLGDELLFASCIPDLVKQGADVFLQCNPRLAPLFARSFPGVTVHGGPRDEALEWLTEAGGVHVQSPAGSLARYLRRSLGDFPAANAYLRPDPNRVMYWRRRLAELGLGLNVGFAWRSRLQDPLRQRRYAQLSEWLDLFRLRGVNMICLQYDDCDAELAELTKRHGVQMTRFPDLDLFNNLDDSVALMSALDRVISVITSTFRFAAGAGVETWLLAPPMRNWVNLGTDHLPWYPSVRVFRQTELGRWDDVVSRVVEECRLLIAGAESIVGEVPATQNVIRATVSVGLASHQRGDYLAAEQAYRDVLRDNSCDAEASMLLGALLAQTGRAEEGLQHVQHALALEPKAPLIYVNLGFVYQKLGRRDEEITAYESACRLDPTLRAARLNLCKALIEFGDVPRSAAEVDRALALFAGDADFLGQCARAWESAGEGARAQALLERAVEVEPSAAVWRNDLGRILFQQGRDALAREQFQFTVRAQPDWAEAWVNLGAATAEPGQAIAHFERALKIDPFCAQAHQNLALNCLAQGDLHRGWNEWSWRLRDAELYKISKAYDWIALWQGEDLRGKTLLVHPEQGIGEEILFASCISDLSAGGVRGIVQCDRRLAPLFARSFPDVTVHAGDRYEDGGWAKELGNVYRRAPGGTLPQYLRTRVADFPQRAHLRADNGGVTTWRYRLAELGTELKVGICWRGGAGGRRSVMKSSALVDWLPILKTAGVRFINLQYAALPHERRQIAQEADGWATVFHDVDLFNDIDETAALVSALDLVICSSGFILHLAGALGQRTWLLGQPVSKYLPLGTHRIPWYPTVKWWPSAGGQQGAVEVSEALAACVR